MNDHFEVRGCLFNDKGMPLDISRLIYPLKVISQEIRIKKTSFKIEHDNFIYPKTIVINTPEIGAYTYIDNRNKDNKEIYFNTGQFLCLLNLGEYEKLLRKIADKQQRKEKVILDELPNLNYDPIIEQLEAYINSIVNYYTHRYISYSYVGECASLNIYTLMVDYIYGHELSHYLDDLFDDEYIGKMQLKLFAGGMKCLTEYYGFNPYREMIEKILNMFNFYANINDFRPHQYWAEELHADYNGWCFCRDIVNDTNLRYADSIIAIGLVMFSFTLFDFISGTIFNQQKSYFTHPPSELRFEMLGRNLYEMLFNHMEYKDFLSKEWGLSIIIKITGLAIIDKLTEKLHISRN